jgi:S-adenosylmethionine:tRNA ribosyltransferase-isomerase
VHCDVIDNTVSGGRVVRFDYPGDDFYKIIDGIGNSPLPPYITRQATKQDKDRYQTVYAENRGAVAAPTGGLHFTEGLIKKLKAKGVKIKPCTLHIGLGTFRPIQVEDLTRHQMDSEFFEVPPETAIAINEAREKDKKIVAVGTSSVRALETVVVSGFQVAPRRGWTDKFIYPPYDFKMTDGMITNFHMPKSTLLMLVSAFGDREFILDAYKLAIKKQYRFLSYGDSMLII